MWQEVLSYLTLHPGVLTVLAMTLVLAVVGLWYVIYHHLSAILITVLTAAGIGSGALVLYRGFQSEPQMKDLIGIGLFLMVIFPAIFWQAIKFLNQPNSIQGPNRES